MSLNIAEEIASELVESDTEYALGAVLARASRRLGFDHYALSLEMGSPRHDDPGVLIHDYPEEWAKIYVAFDLAGRDPVRRACDKSFTGFEWGALDRLIPMTRGDRQMLAVGLECGIGDGYTVPRHLPGEGRGTCTFVVRTGGNLPRPVFFAAEIIGALAMASAQRISGNFRSPGKPALSDRQRECLLWTARGKTAVETAIILGISPETVVQHLKLARERYDVHCRQSLVLYALFDGLIGFDDIFRWRGKGH
ncbi:LuxR family transcriptional regulator [Novosphingobium aquae]|uniref:LuxR family transcriptional regulator n=1 Tax=Novosphingobium aquae TaxID=3133435 RepID=A0ABU8SA21_9SPHN